MLFVETNTFLSMRHRVEDFASRVTRHATPLPLAPSPAREWSRIDRADRVASTGEWSWGGTGRRRT